MFIAINDNEWVNPNKANHIKIVSEKGGFKAMFYFDGGYRAAS